MQAMFTVKNRVFLSNRSDHQSLRGQSSQSESTAHGGVSPMSSDSPAGRDPPCPWQDVVSCLCSRGQGWRRRAKSERLRWSDKARVVLCVGFDSMSNRWGGRGLLGQQDLGSGLRGVECFFPDNEIRDKTYL